MRRELGMLVAGLIVAGAVAVGSAGTGQAACEPDKAATKFAEWASEDMNITVLVDFENNSVETALEVARALVAALGQQARGQQCSDRGDRHVEDVALGELVDPRHLAGLVLLALGAPAAAHSSCT